MICIFPYRFFCLSATLFLGSVAMANDVDAFETGDENADEIPIDASRFPTTTPRLAPDLQTAIATPAAANENLGNLNPVADPFQDALDEATFLDSAKTPINLNVKREVLRARIAADGFLAVEEALLTAVTDEPENQNRVLDLCLFYATAGLHAEALSALRSYGQHDGDATVSLLSGISVFHMGRWQDAIELLNIGQLRQNHDAKILQAAAHAQLGAFQEAAEILPNSPAQLRSVDRGAVHFYLVKAETARAAQNIPALADAVRRLQSLSLNRDERLRTTLLDARLLMMQGQEEAGRKQLERLSRSNALPYADMASIDLLENSVFRGNLDPAIALDKADNLLMGWSGGALEREALVFKAKMEDALGDVRASFYTRRELLLQHEYSDAAGRAEQRMRADLTTLLDRRSLPPLEAAQVFYENVDLAPPGRSGDQLIRKVADKLAALDLVREAAELLHHQTFNRLRGPARSKTAADLARLYLAADDPAKALQAIRSTRLSRLPEALNNERRWLEAKALIGADSEDAALELLDGDDSREAFELRGDIFWSRKAWREAGSAFQSAAEAMGDDGEQFGRTKSVLILRAASAYGLAGAKPELRRVAVAASGKLVDTDANHLLEAIAYGDLAEDPTAFLAAYRAFFSDTHYSG